MPGFQSFLSRTCHPKSVTIRTNHLNKKIVQQHLTQLSPDGRESYDAVKKRTGRLQKHNGKEYVQISDAVDKLLVDGLLESHRDSEGESLVKNLHDLCYNKQIPKSHRNNMIGWTITHLAYPEDSLNQVDGKGTCTAAVLSYDLAQENGAEFARLVEGLASKSRKVTLANGDILERAVGSVEGSFSKGTPVARMLQASFMNYADPDQTYRIKIDEFENSKDTGLHKEPLERLYEAVENRDLELRKVDGPELEALLETVDDSIPVCLRWSETETEDKEKKHGHHMVLVKALDDDWVEFRNPWGPTESKELSEYGREILDNGHERFPRNEFFDRLTYAVIPEGWELPKEESKPHLLGWLIEGFTAEDTSR